MDWRGGTHIIPAYLDDSLPEPRVMPDGPIQTTFLYPPIPLRWFDWCAYRDPEPGNLYGYGATEEAAIADLLEQEADQ